MDIQHHSSVLYIDKILKRFLSINLNIYKKVLKIVVGIFGYDSSSNSSRIFQDNFTFSWRKIYFHLYDKTPTVEWKVYF